MGENTGLHKRRAEIASGLPVTELAKIFRTNNLNVRRKLASVKPIGERAGDPVYDIADAAACLVKPRVDLAEYIKTLRPADVPVALQKQFWDAQLGRQKFEEQAGQLWRTEKVQTAVGDVFKVVRQKVRLFADAVDRESALNEEQRVILTRMSDELLEDMFKAVVEHFTDYDSSEERDDIYENGPPAAAPLPDEVTGDEPDETEEPAADDGWGGL